MQDLTLKFFLKAIVSLFKVAKRGGDVAGVLTDIVDDVKTLVDPNASMLDKGFSVVSLVTGVDSKWMKKIAKAARGKKPASAGTCSFVAGTLVMTKDGLKPIEQIKAGDYVLARDEYNAGGELAWKRVVVAYNHLHDDILQLSLENAQSGVVEQIITTSEHPFYVEGRGWSRADQLQEGDFIPSANGGWVKVTGATWLQKSQLAYNMEVAEFHTYFVGESGAWVHNECDKNHHNANVRVKDKDGNTISKERYVSGNMTAEEKTMGYPQGQLASHTEARAMKDLDLQEGQQVIITGQKRPCNSCKGKMNTKSRETGANIRYQWRENGKTQTWEANKK